MRWLIAASLVAAIAVGACGGEDEGAGVPYGPLGDPTFGFNDNSVRSGLVTPAGQAALAARAGADVVRFTFDWRFAERVPGAYDFRVYDGIYAALRARGIRPLWIVMFAPAWARDRGAACPGDCRLPPSRAGERRFAAIAARIAARYPRSAGIEVWNEPNLTTFWQPRPDARRYTRLLRATYAAVKRAAPRMPVVNGGLSNNRVTDERGNVAMGEFLEQMYDSGARGAMDAVSFHPYPVRKDDSLLLPSVGRVLDVLKSRRDARRPLWITELGATTTGTDPELVFSPREQSRTLAGAFCRLAHVPRVRMVLAHTLLAPGGPTSSAEPGYALITPQGKPQPAFRALARRARGDCAGTR